MLLIWCGDINWLSIPSSSQHKFHERNLHIWHLKEYSFCICGKISNVCFHKRPRYYDKHVQLVILLRICDTSIIQRFSRSQTWHFKGVGVHWYWRVWCHLGMVFWYPFKHTLTNTQVEPRWCILHNIWCNSCDNMTMKITVRNFCGSWRHSWINIHPPIILGHHGQEEEIVKYECVSLLFIQHKNLTPYL